MFLEISQNSQENTFARVYFLIKMQAWGLRCFPVNFVKFLRTPSLQNTSGRLLLKSFYIDVHINVFNKDVFILYLSLWWREFWTFLIFSFSSEKQCFKIQEINKQTKMKWFLFLKKKVIWIDKLKFKNISIILF